MRFSDPISSVVASVLSLPVGDVPEDRPFADLGLDSARAVQLAAALSAKLGIDVSPIIAWEHPTVRRIRAHLMRGEAPSRRTHASAAGLGRMGEDVAIIGMACRFPGSPTQQAYWQLLLSGGDAVTKVPRGRWDAETLPDGPPHGGFIADPWGFDAGYFGISPREAHAMDPQQRLALEVTSDALRDAGLSPGMLHHRVVGTFFGAMWVDYAHLTGSHIGGHTATGLDASIIAGRIAYAFGFCGPTLVLNTACSSSLASLHLAVNSLRLGEADVAVVGGVSLMLAPNVSLAMQALGTQSASGRCRAFSANADGYVRGEGCGVVILKPLSAAVGDNDRIYAVVRGSAINNNGRGNGLTAPSVTAQVDLLRRAYEVARVDAGSVTYVETHGPGTALGDPIEAQALTTVLCEGRPNESPLLLGSCKTNIGHLEATAGVAGLIKAALTLHHGRLPGNLHFNPQNPRIPFDAWKLQVLDKQRPWPPSRPRIAGVSSFGFGGTNVHAVLAAAPGPSVAPRSMGTARGAGRTTPVPGRPRASPRSASRSQPLAAVFTGQGVAWSTATRDALFGNRTARCALNLCWHHLEEMAGGDASLGAHPHDLFTKTVDDSPKIQHLRSFCFQIARFEELRATAVDVSGVIGHSTGEIVAAYAAGCLTLREAAQLAFVGACVAEHARGLGTAIAVEASPDRIEQLQRQGQLRGVEIAAINSDTSVTIAVRTQALQSVEQAIASMGVRWQRVLMAYPPHSQALEAGLDKYASRFEGFVASTAQIPYYSSVLGRRVVGEELDSNFWRRNVRCPALLRAAAEAARADGISGIIEIAETRLLDRLLESSGFHVAPLHLPSVAAAPADSGRFPVLDRSGLEGNRVFPVSAASPVALRRRLLDIKGWIGETPPPDVDDLAYTLQRVSSEPERACIVASSRVDVARGLAAAAERVSDRGRPQPGLVAFVCAGQGGQWAGMGRALLSYPPFHLALRQCDVLIRRHGGWSPLELLRGEDPVAFSRPEVLQPLLFSITVASAMLWRACGIEASGGIIGHSQGEIAAAHLVGALSLEDAVRLIILRGTMIQRFAPRGALALLALPPDEITRRFGQSSWEFSAFNGPNNTLIGGDRSTLEGIIAQLADTNTFGRLVDVDFSAHTSKLQTAATELVERIRITSARAPALPLYSSTRGAAVSDEIGDRDYWGDNLLRPVDFTAAANAALDSGVSIFVELGPHPVLAEAIRSCSAARDQTPHMCATMARSQGQEVFLQGLADLYEIGLDPDWALVSTAGRVVSLPAYPWDHTRFDPPDGPPSFALPRASSSSELGPAKHVPPLPGARPSVGDGSPAGSTVFDVKQDALRSLLQHEIQGVPIFPAVEYLRLVLAAASQEYPRQHFALRDITIEHPLPLRAGAPTETRLLVSWHDDNTLEFGYCSRRDDSWLPHAKGYLTRQTRSLDSQHLSVQIRLPGTTWTAAELYSRLHALGLHYGPAFRRLDDISVAGGVASARIKRSSEDGNVAIITMLDAGLQLCYALMPQGTAAVPVAIAEFSFADAQVVEHGFATAKAVAGSDLRFDIEIVDGNDGAVASFRGVRFDLIEAAGTRADILTIDYQPTKGSPSADQSPTRPIVICEDPTLRMLVRNAVGARDAVDGLEKIDSFDGAAEVIYCFGRATAPDHLAELVGRIEALERLRIRLQGASDATVRIVIHHGDGLGDATAAVARGLRWDRAGQDTRIVELAGRELPSPEALLVALTHSSSDLVWAPNGGLQVPRLRRTARGSSVARGSGLELRPEATYLVAGGFGGLGRKTCHWLVRHGARRIAILARTELPPRRCWNDATNARVASQVAHVRALESAGATVVVKACDLGSAEQIDRAIEALGMELPPIRGIFHAAGVWGLTDGEAADQRMVRRTLEAKVVGARRLHELSSTMDLDYFIVFSSVVALWGAARLGHYAAANGYLRDLIAERRAQGLPGQVVHWGPWASVGMVADAGRERDIEDYGLGLLAPGEALAALGSALSDHAEVAIVRADWVRLSQQLRQLRVGHEFLEELCPAVEATATQSPALGEPSAAAESSRRIEDELEVIIRRVFRFSETRRVDREIPLTRLGLDSIIASELGACVQKELGVRLSAMEMLAGASIRSLAAKILVLQGSSHDR